MKKLIILFTLLSLGVAACKKKKNDEQFYGICGTVTPSYVSFGRSFNECGGDCAEFYEIRNNTLYGDSMNTYNGTPVFSAVPMTNAQRIIAMPVMNMIPAYGPSFGDTTFGCPDCHDQGGLHVSFRIHPGDPLTTWHADTDSTQQPPALRPFFRKVNDVIDQLP